MGCNVVSYHYLWYAPDFAQDSRKIENNSEAWKLWFVPICQGNAIAIVDWEDLVCVLNELIRSDWRGSTIDVFGRIL